MNSIVRSTFVIAVAVLALSARADALGDLRDTLAALAGREPIQATVDITTTAHDSEDPEGRQGHAAFPVQADDAGLKISYGSDVLARLGEEARLSGSDKPRPVTTAIRGLKAIDVAEAVNYAPALARALVNSTLREQKTGPWQGHPARILTFGLDVPLSEKDRKHIKEATATLTLWTTTEGLPLAAQQRVYTKARFLLMSFENSSTTDFTFVRWGDRLVASRRAEKNSGSGMGQNFENGTVQLVTRN